MLRGLRKAAQSLERGMETAFSTAPASHSAFVHTTLTIGDHRVRLGPVFAEGGFSFIHVATPSGTPSSCTTRFAVKRMSCADSEASAQARREIDFLSALPPHPNIVRFHGATFRDGHAFLLFDLVDGGTLPEVLERASRPLTPEARLDILGDAVAAVAHLHAQEPPVAVRDVKLENLLYDRLEKCYKLCDFGSVSSFAGRHVLRKEILAAEDDIANSCTAMYRAPEITDLYAKQFVCERVDVWALGCVWYALLYGKLPFDGMSSLQILKGLQFVPPEPQFPDGYVELLKGMLAVSPADRLDAIAVLETIRRLQGRHIDPELRRIGAGHRAQRRRDFTREGTGTAATAGAGNDPCPGASGFDLFGTTADPMPRAEALSSSAPHQSELINFDTVFPSPTPSAKVGTQPPAKANEEDDWADFESAFSNTSFPQPSPAPKTTLSALAQSSSTLPSAAPLLSTLPTSTQPSSARPPSSTVPSCQLNSSARPPPLASRGARDNLVSPAGSVPLPTHSKTTSLIDFSDLHIAPPTTKSTPDASKRPALENKSRAARSAPDFSDLIDFG